MIQNSETEQEKKNAWSFFSQVFEGALVVNDSNESGRDNYWNQRYNASLTNSGSIQVLNQTIPGVIGWDLDMFIKGIQDYFSCIGYEDLRLKYFDDYSADIEAAISNTKCIYFQNLQQAPAQGSMYEYKGVTIYPPSDMSSDFDYTYQIDYFETRRVFLNELKKQLGIA